MPEIQPEGIGAEQGVYDAREEVFAFVVSYEDPRGGQGEAEMGERGCVVPERLDRVFEHRGDNRQGGRMEGHDVFVIQGQLHHGWCGVEHGVQLAESADVGPGLRAGGGEGERVHGGDTEVGE